MSTCFEETTTAHNFLVRNGSYSRSGVRGSEVSTDASCSGNAAAAAFEFDFVTGTLYPIIVYPCNQGAAGEFGIQVTTAR